MKIKEIEKIKFQKIKPENLLKLYKQLIKKGFKFLVGTSNNQLQNLCKHQKSKEVYVWTLLNKKKKIISLLIISNSKDAGYVRIFDILIKEKEWKLEITKLIVHFLKNEIFLKKEKKDIIVSFLNIEEEDLAIFRKCGFEIKELFLFLKIKKGKRGKNKTNKRWD